MTMPQKQLERDRQKEINTFSTVTREAERHDVNMPQVPGQRKKEAEPEGALNISVPREVRDKTVSNNPHYSKWNKLTESPEPSDDTGISPEGEGPAE